MKVSREWEDDELAHIRYLDCDCGTRIIEDKSVESGDEVECPKCGKRYKFVWGGMRVIELKEKK